MNTFKVEKSTESENGGFVNTITAQIGTKKVFGQEVPVKLRFCIKTPTEVAVGTEQELDLDEFNITEYKSDQGTTRYLHPNTAD